MRTDEDMPGYAVDPKLLLRYLIQKSVELLQPRRSYTVFPLPFRGLGATVLAPFPELQKDFIEIVSQSEDSVSERAGKCREIFIEALARPHEGNPEDPSDDSSEEDPFDRVIANRFCWAARREGEEMLKRKNYEFVSVWEFMTWIGLRGDAEKFKDFQEKCLRYSDPEQKIEQVTPILWEAMTRKPKKDQIDEQKNCEPGNRPRPGAMVTSLARCGSTLAEAPMSP
jgi:hypothetical protein